MNKLLVIIAAIFLAILQLAGFITIFHINITFSFVTIIGLSFILSGHKDRGTIILLLGSLVLDIFSPFRPGLYLLMAVIILITIDYLVGRSFEFSNPLIMTIIALFSFILMGLIPFVYNLMIITYLVNILVNTFVTILISLFMDYFSAPNDSSLEIGENVGFR
jgi:hypothetical protein